MANSDGKFDINQIPMLDKADPSVLRRAAIVACSFATDLDEAREFVGMLGLLGDRPVRL